MRYAQIREMDISNGKGIGISIYTQGCYFNCPNCFNQSTHNPQGGKPWGFSETNQVLELLDREYISRITILGGEPLINENLSELPKLIQSIRDRYGDTKQIWIYSGYTYEELDDERKNIVHMCDVLVDGRFVDELKDFRLKFKGSSNQRVIDIPKTIANQNVILLEED